MTTAQERADLDALAELGARPTAPRRAVRTVGQASVAYVVLDLAEAFNWFGSAHWTSDQWKAVTAAGVAVVAAVQNLGPAAAGAVRGWWSRRRATS